MTLDVSRCLEDIGIINIYLGKSAMTINPSIKLKWFLDAIRAGATEEIIFRFFSLQYVFILPMVKCYRDFKIFYVI